MQMKEEVNKTALTSGHPEFILTILGIWKILGAVAVLIPKYPLLKEWAYAGFFFVLSGAIFSHLAVKDPASVYVGPTILLILTFVSLYWRPADRTIKTLKPKTHDQSTSELVFQ